MSTIKLHGAKVHLEGKFIEAGQMAPNFSLVKNDLSTFTLNDCKGNYLLMNIFPSIDTGVCSASVRKFNVMASKMRNTLVLCISKDLPFAQVRFCGIEGIDRAITLSDFRNSSDFGREYGVMIADGPMKGLFARAVILINPKGEVFYSELVPDISHEPDYERALEALYCKGETVIQMEKECYY